jgi:hypothetical protein
MSRNTLSTTGRMPLCGIAAYQAFREEGLAIGRRPSPLGRRAAPLWGLRGESLFSLVGVSSGICRMTGI